MKKLLTLLSLLLVFCVRGKVTERVKLLPIKTIKEEGIAHKLAFSPDGQFLACAGGRYTDVKVLNTSSWTKVKSLTGHNEPIWVVSFHPNGKYLVSAGWDGTIRIWQTSDWKEVKVLTGHKGGVFSMAFSPDGKFLASGGNDSLVRIWLTEGWTEIKTLPGHQAKVTSVAFSPNSDFLASGSYDQTVKVWKTQDWSEIKTLPTKGIVHCVNFSPDGYYLVSDGWKNIYLWDTRNWSQINKLKFRPISFIGFHPNGKYLLASDWACPAFRIPIIEKFQIRIWDTQDWSLVGKKTLNELASTIAISPDGKSIVFGQKEEVVICELSGK